MQTFIVRQKNGDTKYGAAENYMIYLFNISFVNSTGLTIEAPKLNKQIIIIKIFKTIDLTLNFFIKKTTPIKVVFEIL